MGNRRQEEMKAKLKTKSKSGLTDLPPDTLLHILRQLHRNDRISLSLVSKSFRFLAYDFTHKFTFKYVPSKPQFRTIFSRFSSVNHIVFRFADRISRALKAVSKYKIESLELCNFAIPKPERVIKLAGKLGMVKVLKLDWFAGTVDTHVVDLIHMFTSLEELGLKHCLVWTDAGIQKLASNAPKLRKINLNHNKNLTDKSLDALACCVSLEHISFHGCVNITVRGFCSFARQRKNSFKFLEVPNYFWSAVEDDMLELVETISCCENLSHVVIKGIFFRHNILSDIVNSRSLSTSLKLRLERCTMAQLSGLLLAFPGLTRLHLHLFYRDFQKTQDMEMSQIVKSLTCLKDVYISEPCYATLFSLIENCPLLERICSGFKVFRYKMPEVIKKNYSIQHIQLRGNRNIYFETVLKSICLSLKSLEWRTSWC